MAPDVQQAVRPDDTPFKQQKLRAWQPVLTPPWAAAVFLVFGIVFIPIGAWLIEVSKGVKEYSVKYDGKGKDVSDCAITANGEGRDCQISISVTEDMEQPVYVYYELTNFYQNHRRYVKSRSSSQLLGEVNDVDLDDCEPLKTAGSLTLHPCGLIANSMFSDIIEVSSGTTSGMSESGIAWGTDRRDRFVQPDGFTSSECDLNSSCEACLGAGFDDCQNYTDESGRTFKYWYPRDDTTQYLYETYPNIISPLEGVTSERFMVWMRTAALPTFRKLYGVIDEDISAGTTVVFSVENNFHVSGFGGSKSLVLTTVSQLGTKNSAIGWGYVTLGCACVVIGITFLVKQASYGRATGAPDFLKLDT